MSAGATPGVDFPPVGTDIDVVFFKPSGKFYTDEKIKITSSAGLPTDRFELSVYRAVEGRLEGMWAVSTDPKLPWPMSFRLSRAAQIAVATAPTCTDALDDYYSFLQDGSVVHLECDGADSGERLEAIEGRVRIALRAAGRLP